MTSGRPDSITSPEIDFAAGTDFPRTCPACAPTAAATITSDTSLSDGARVMHEANVRRLVVADERGRIAGIVSRSDLLQVFLRADEELREEIRRRLIPAVVLSLADAIGVEVSWNIANLSGEVERKSDAEILTRLTKELDGVVGVVDQLRYRWDDTDIAPV